VLRAGLLSVLTRVITMTLTGNNISMSEGE